MRDRLLAAENRSLEVFLGGLQTLWHSSQPRRRKPKPRTGKRSRPDPFEPDVALIEQCLVAEPMIRAKTLLERLLQYTQNAMGNATYAPCNGAYAVIGCSGSSRRWSRCWMPKPGFKKRQNQNRQQWYQVSKKTGNN